MLLDLIDFSKLKRALVYLVFLIVLFLIQNILIPLFPIAGVKAFIVPIAVACVSLFEGGIWGVVFGLVVGYCTDLSLPESTVGCMLIFSISGFLIGTLGKYSLRKGFISGFVVSLASLIITAFFQSFSFIFFKDASLGAVIRVSFLQVLWSLPFIPLIYYPCHSIAERDLNVND